MTLAARFYSNTHVAAQRFVCRAALLTIASLAAAANAEGDD